jgi:hypothetical protein
MALEWGERPYEVGKMSAVGNVFARQTRPTAGCVLSLGGDGDLEYYGRDNVAIDQHGNPLPLFGRYGHTKAKLIEVDKPPSWPAGLEVHADAGLETHLMANVGARPGTATRTTCACSSSSPRARRDHQRREGRERLSETQGNARALRRGRLGSWRRWNRSRACTPGQKTRALRPLSA